MNKRKKYEIKNRINNWIYKIFFSFFLRKRKIILHGGLGDAILLTQFLKSEIEKIKNRKIEVYFRDDVQIEKGKPENYSWGKTRHYTGLGDQLNNPIKEWLDNFSFIKLKFGCDVTLEKGEYWIPEFVQKKFGGYLIPEEFNNQLIKRYLGKNRVSVEKAKQFIKTNGLENKFIVGIHFRRQSEKIYELYQMMLKKYPNIYFIAMGSTEHEIIPELKERTISLIDSYKIGLDVNDVFNIGRHMNLYIGGRGGFELFYWLCEIPSINFFDEIGMLEIERKWWDKNLWEKNKISELFNEFSELDRIDKEYIESLIKENE
jgi:hypothetical protein